MSDISSETNSQTFTDEFESEFRSSNAAFILENPNNLKNSNTSYAENDRKVATPEDSLADFEMKKVHHDISTKCLTCHSYINMSELKDHVEYHDALTALNLKKLPPTLKALMKRRKNLIKSCTLKNLSEINKGFNAIQLIEWENGIRKVNYAFELIKSYMTLTFDDNRKFKNEFKIDVLADSFIPSNPSITAISLCSNQNKTHQKAMEDNSTIIEMFGGDSNKTYIGLFDGYEGGVSSEMCSKQLHLALMNYISKFDENVQFKLDLQDDYDEVNHLDKYENSQVNDDTNKTLVENDDDDEDTKINKYLSNIKDAFYKSYKQMDKLVSRGRNEKSRVRWSGATSATCIVDTYNKDNSWLHMANCGNVEAMMIYNDLKDTNSQRYKVITRLHNLNTDEKERKRIEKTGARIFETSKGNYKIESLLDITRAFGFYGDSSIKRFVCCVPTIQSVKLDDNCACLLIATKGLWNTLSYKKVASLVLQMLPSNVIMDPRAPDPSVTELLERPYTNTQNRTEVETDEQVKEYVMTHSKLTNITGNEDIDDEEDNQEEEDYENYYANFKNMLEAHARPRTAPQTHKNNKKNVELEFDDNYERIAPIKASSDIYPVCAVKHGKDNPERPISVDYNDTIYINPVNNTMDTNFTNLNTQFLIKQTTNEFVQVDKHEINEALRYLMDPISRHKLEFADMISRKVVTSALMAGCTDNISVCCVLLSGSGI